MAKKGKRVVKSTPGKPPVYEPEQAAGCEDEPEAGPATEATVRPGPVSEPDIEEYPQPEDCPYEGYAVTVLIGPGEKQYTIPRSLIDKFPALLPSSLASKLSSSKRKGICQNNQPPTIRLPDVDEDVGHTLMHYLYTGGFQTLRPPSACDIPKRTKEYTRSVLAYRTALNYGLKPLEDHAKRYMEIFDRYVHIFDIIRLSRKEFPNIINYPWYSDYPTAKVLAAFDVEDGIFLREEYFERFGEAPEFDRFLGKVMALAYSKKISAMRSGRVRGKGTGLRIKPEFEGYRRPAFGNGSQSCMTGDAGFEYLQHSPISMITPDSNFGEDSTGEQTPSSSQTGLKGHQCPNWQTHLLDEKFYKNCNACRTRILQMFVDLVP